MITLTQIYAELTRYACLHSWSIPGAKAATVQTQDGNHIFMDHEKIENHAEEKRILAHELGHIQTGTMHSVSSPCDLVERHEERAERWTIKHLLPYDEMCYAIRNGCRTTWELAEYFEVPDELIHKAIDYYTCACGLPLYEGLDDCV